MLYYLTDNWNPFSKDAVFYIMQNLVGRQDVGHIWGGK